MRSHSLAADALRQMIRLHFCLSLEPFSVTAGALLGDAVFLYEESGEAVPIGRAFSAVSGFKHA